MDGESHNIGQWDMMIAHPPCTYLSNAGAARLYKRFGDRSYVELQRLNKGLDAKEFFEKLLNANIPYIAIENPVPSGVYRLPRYSQVIEPYYFGDPIKKKTCLWLRNLPLLEPTNIVEVTTYWVSGGSKRQDGTPRNVKTINFRDGKTRSKSFAGVANAMADQWGKFVSGGDCSVKREV